MGCIKASWTSYKWNRIFRGWYDFIKKNAVSGLTTAASLWLSAAIGLAVGIGYYEGALIATIICLITLVSLKSFNDFINKRVIKSYTMFFDAYNFDQVDFLNFTSKEGVEVRKLEIVNEEVDDISVVESTLCFQKNYNISMFFEKIKSNFDLKSVKKSNEED